jgi:hypothetical protein
MSELPVELDALSSKASSDDDKRHAIGVAIALLLVAGRARADAVKGALVAALLAAAVAGAAFAAGWAAHDRLAITAATAFFVLFPLAVRLLRNRGIARLRARFARDGFGPTWRALTPAMATAWLRATPGQRAALLRITKSPP